MGDREHMVHMKERLLMEELYNYLELLESELCHEMLSKPLQAVAIQGLKTITGLDLVEWKALQIELLELTFKEDDEFFGEIGRSKHQWGAYFTSMLKFIEITIEESCHFYEDDDLKELETLDQQGKRLFEKLLDWLKEMKDLT